MPGPRITVPEGHGEVVSHPPLDQWADRARENAAAVRSWDFCVAGRPVGDVRRACRAESLRLACDYTSSLGLAPTAPTEDDAPVIVTGHQPELFHPGIWAKYFMVQRVCEEVDGHGIGLVVDSEVFGSVSAAVPCDAGQVGRCVIRLAGGDGETCYGRAPAPDPRAVEAFCEAAAAAIGPLNAPALERNLDGFCEALRIASAVGGDVARLVTGARRRYEGALTDYRDLSVLQLAETASYRAFVADIIGASRRFAECYNGELASYRAARSVRSDAQPFPDLGVTADATELPFWLIGKEGTRARPFVREEPGGMSLSAGEVTERIPADPAALVEQLAGARVVLAPRALTLTLFARTFLADLFVHGVGGSRYDEVTEGVARAFWGIDLPPFAAVSLTMQPPLDALPVSAEDVAELDRTLKRLEHNPDEFLDDVEFADAGQEAIARGLAATKSDLVGEIQREGADRKELGMRIRDINAKLAEVVEPVAAEVESERRHLVSQLETSAVLTDRRYPLCFWSPEEVADKLR